MKFIADANVLFSLAKPDSVTSDIVKTRKVTLLAPDFAIIELHKYKEDLLTISGEKNFASVIESLKKKVVFVDYSEYKDKMNESSLKISDQKDVTYLALAVKLNIPIWSNDKQLKEQSIVDVFTTKEVIELLKNRIS